MSSAKTCAFIYALGGLIGGLFFLLISLVTHNTSTANSSTFFLIMGIGAPIVFPILYGIGGFVIGAMTAFLYNLTAKWTGGLEFEIE